MDPIKAESGQPVDLSREKSLPCYEMLTVWMLLLCCIQYALFYIFAVKKGYDIMVYHEIFLQSGLCINMESLGSMEHY